MKILLIEDDQLLGEGVKSALTHFSYVVDWMKTAAQGLSALTQETYALVILHLGLPDTDGLSVLRTIRARNMQLPVLILTARGEVDDKLAGLDAGSDD